jgi:integrase
MTKTVEQWLNEWLEVYVKPCKKENTYECYKYVIIMINKQRPELEQLCLSDIDELYLQKLLNQSAAKYSKSTLKKMKIIFKNAYNAAIRNNICLKNPALDLCIPEAPEKEIRSLTRQEEEIIVAAAMNDILGHLALFMLETGLRASELMDLKWIDYNPEKDEIYIRKSKTKNGIRIVPLTVEAKKIIENQKHYCDYIFTSTIKRPVTKTVLRKLYDRLRKATGIDIVTNHVYRHSFATRMVEKKADYKALSVILGHKNVAFTIHRYADAETSFLHEQIALKDQKPKKRIMHFKSMHAFRG